MLLMSVIPEMYRVEIFYFCLIFFVAVALIMLSCTFSETAILPDFIVETWVFGCIKVNPMTLLLRILWLSQECNQGCCFVLWPCLLDELFLGLQKMCQLHVHAFHVLGKLRIYLFSLQDVESSSWYPSLLILCQSLQ